MKKKENKQKEEKDKAEDMKLLDAKKIDREALLRIKNNKHSFARDQTILIQPQNPRYLSNKLKQWRA